MKSLLLFAGLACFVVAESCFAADSDAENEWEEVVVKRKKKKAAVAEAETTPDVVVAPAVVAIPAMVTVPVAVPVAKAKPASLDENDKPPPEPPDAEATEPRRLVHYFCKLWKDEDYESMWWAMSPQYRKKVSLNKFTKLFMDDKETNGGLLEENILETAKTRKGNKGVKVELIFRFPKAKHKIAIAEAERQPGGVFRLVESTLLPLDLDDL